MLIKNKWLPFMLLPLLALFTSCQDYLYEEEQAIPEAIWTYADALQFTLPISDTTVVYNLYLEIKHKQDYEFENVYSLLKVKMPDGELNERQVSLELASPKGKWEGECQGEFCQRRLIFMPNIKFNQLGNYKIEFQQYSRQDSLPGIASLKLLLETAKAAPES